MTEAGFTSYEDQQVNGDPPLDESLPMITEQPRRLLGRHGQEVRRRARARGLASRRRSPAAGGSDGGVVSDTVIYCADTDSIVYASTTLQKASDEIGDMARRRLHRRGVGLGRAADLGYRIGTGRPARGPSASPAPGPARCRRGTAHDQPHRGDLVLARRPRRGDRGLRGHRRPVVEGGPRHGVRPVHPSAPASQAARRVPDHVRPGPGAAHDTLGQPGGRADVRAIRLRP